MTVEPRTFPTYRDFRAHSTPTERPKYELLAHLIKKYGCPVTKVSDGFNWIRVYFEIPKENVDEFLKEEKQEQ